MKMFAPSSRSQVPPFLVMDVMEAADRAERAGEHVYHLEVGQPGTPAPALVREAAHRAIDEQTLGYSRAIGTIALRERIARHYDETYGVSVDPERVIVTSGASGAFVLSFIAAFEAGSRVALTVPGYPCYPNILKSLDLEVESIRVGPGTKYALTVQHLEALRRPPRGLVIASPANPTGTMLGSECLSDLLSYCRAQGIFTIVDEIYHGLEFGKERATTAAAFADSTIVVGSFSKYYSMTGWRLGWMVVPDAFRRTAEVLSQNLAICAPTLSQIAAVSAFDARDELEGHVARYRRNRGALLEALREAGVAETAPADGAFYVYADVSAFCEDSRELCEALLERTGVAATSGVDFDPEKGKSMVRFSYCRGEADVNEAAHRIREFLLQRRRERG